MRLLCISDLHGRYGNIEEIRGELRRAEVVIIAGDITNFGGKDEARNILREFMASNPVVLAIHGNCDNKEVNEALKEFKISLHGRGLVYEDIGFFGVGGSNSTPFSTPQEFPEESLVETARKGYSSLVEVDKKVFVTHTPASGILDRTGSGHNTGSKGLREFIRQSDIDLVVSGHIHEARGTEVWQGKTFVNPGPFHMGYARVDFNRVARVEMVTL